jgi:serine/threonine-protein kinase HipA
MIAKERDWKLSPAYDLNPMAQVSLERRDLALICGDQGRTASAKNLQSQAGRFLLDAGKAAAIIGSMKDKVKSSWYETARAVGVSEKDCEKIAGAFVYPGFDLDHVEPVV